MDGCGNYLWLVAAYTNIHVCCVIIIKHEVHGCIYNSCIYMCDLNVEAHKNIGCICKNCMFSYTNKHDIKSFITV